MIQPTVGRVVWYLRHRMNVGDLGRERTLLITVPNRPSEGECPARSSHARSGSGTRCVQ